MSHHKPSGAELPSIDAASLDKVTGGAAMDPTMLMMMMMGRQQAAAPAPAPAPAQPWKPKVLLNGVEQSVGTGADGAMTFNSSG